MEKKPCCVIMFNVKLAVLIPTIHHRLATFSGVTSEVTSWSAVVMAAASLLTVKSAPLIFKAAIIDSTTGLSWFALSIYFLVLKWGPAMHILVHSIESIEWTKSNLNDHTQNQCIISTVTNRSVEALLSQSTGWHHSYPWTNGSDKVIRILYDSLLSRERISSASMDKQCYQCIRVRYVNPICGQMIQATLQILQHGWEVWHRDAQDAFHRISSYLMRVILHG